VLNCNFIFVVSAEHCTAG